MFGSLPPYSADGDTLDLAPLGEVRKFGLGKARGAWSLGCHGGCRCQHALGALCRPARREPAAAQGALPGARLPARIVRFQSQSIHQDGRCFRHMEPGKRPLALRPFSPRTLKCSQSVRERFQCPVEDSLCEGDRDSVVCDGHILPVALANAAHHLLPVQHARTAMDH